VKIILPVAALTAAVATALPAGATSGQLDSFSASATSIRAGETVDFSAAFSISTSTWSGGGSNPVEPEPIEGYQTWEVNWYNSMSETVASVQLEAAGMTFNDFPSAGPGGSYANSWSFSVLFADAGTHSITLTGSWSTLTESYISTESASRDCYNNDPGGSDQLTCSGWTWSYYDYTDSSTFDSGFIAQTLTIQVNAVPEPQTLALWLAGIGVLAAVHRRRSVRDGSRPRLQRPM
jgi:hypothetical protein